MSFGTSMNPYKAVAWHAESVRPEESRSTFTDLSNDLWRQAWETFNEDEPRLAQNYQGQLPRCLALLDEPRRTSGAARDELYAHQQQQFERAVKLLCKRSGRSERFIECAHGLLKSVQWSSDLVSAAISSHRYASLPWVGISLILPVMLEATQQSESMISGLDHVAKLIWLYEIRSRQRQEQMSSGELCTAVVDMYRLILGYQARVLLHLCHSVVGRALRNEYRAVQWEDLMAPIEEADANCSIFKACFDQEAEQKQMTRQYQQCMAIRTEIPETIQSSELYRREQEIFSSFSSNYAADKNFHTNRVEGTCRWFLDDPTFKRWKDTSAARLLWLSAEPGRGKSVLARCLIDERHLLNSPTSTTCYFFFNESTEGRHTAANALTAILHQLLDQCQGADLIQYAMPRFKVYKEGLKDNFQELWSVFIQAVSDPALGEVICILDGLDECEGANRTLLLHALEEFYTRKPRPDAELKFLITSRPYHDIRYIFASMASEVDLIHFAGDSRSSIIRNEINLVIAHRISKLADHLSIDIQTAIRRQLETTRDVTYLWVDLIFLEIEGSLPTLSTGKKMNNKIRTLLVSLPSSVNKAYENILKKCRFPTEARTMFKIVIAARRPLTVLELNVAYEVATDPDVRSYHGTDGIDLPPQDLQESRIRDLCGFFLTIHESQVQFLHLTAKEYLLGLSTFGGKLPKLLDWAMSSQDCELLMLKVAVKVLRLQEMNQPHPWARARAWYSWTDEELQTIAQYPLFRYCAQHWISHYRLGYDEGSELREDILALCDPSVPRLACWLSVYCLATGQQPPLNEPRIVIGACLGILDVVSAEVEEIADPAAIDYAVGEALSQAARYGQQNVVDFLLSRTSKSQRGPDDLSSNTSTKSGSTFTGKPDSAGSESAGLYLIPGYLRSALEVACIKGHVGIVEALLQHGAQFDLDIMNDTFNSGFSRITAMLLTACPDSALVRDLAVKALNGSGCGGDIKARREWLESNLKEPTWSIGTSRFRRAAMVHYDDIPALRRLLQSSLEDHLSSMTEAISFTAHADHIRAAQVMLQFVLQNKITDIMDSVSLAVRKGNITTLRMLLKSIIEDDAFSITRAVSLAVRSGDTPALCALLESNLRGHETSITEAVLLAVLYGNIPALKTLLHLDLQERISNIEWAVSLAADGNSPDLLQVILTSGMEILLEDRMAALKKALDPGSNRLRTKVARLLSEVGAWTHYTVMIAGLDDEQRVKLGIAWSAHIYCDLMWTRGRIDRTRALEALETDCKAPFLTASHAVWIRLLKTLAMWQAELNVDADLHERLLVRACEEDPQQIVTVIELREKSRIRQYYKSEAFINAVGKLEQEEHHVSLMQAGWLSEDDSPFSLPSCRA